jgi:UDP-N-acetylmuramate dehydrogenase
MSVLRGKALFDEPMALHTSLKVGGPADCHAIPADIVDLRNLVGFLEELKIPYLPVGGGCNLLVRDGGFRGVTISLEELTHLGYTGEDIIEAESGVENQALVHFALGNGLTGLEFMIGIPGRLGGALAMNAGAGGHMVLDRLERLSTLLNGSVTAKGKEDIQCGYRFLKLAPGEVIVGASFRLERESREVISTRIADFLDHRRKTQQVGFPSAGSFFRNPPEKPAWRLIEETGLRGYRIGGAQVSEVHANFLVNRGGAKAADFVELAMHVKEEVKRRTGITLEEEVKIAGVD